MPKEIKNLELNRSKELTNCNEGRPLITFGGGDAPVLNYRMPQSCSFTTYGNIVLNVKNECWTKKALFEYKTEMATKPAIEIAQHILNESFNIYTSKSVLSTKLSESVKHITAEQLKVSTEKFEALKSIAKVATKLDSQDYVALEKATYLAEKIKAGELPIVKKRFNGLENKVTFIKRPKKCVPRLFIIEEYKTTSFLSNYGAGKTVNTFSLLPGEKTTINIKTFKEIIETRALSSNIVDSFSKESADEFENTLENESSVTDTSSRNETETNTDNSTSNWEVKPAISLEVFGLFDASIGGVGGGGTGSSSTTNTVSNSSARTANVKNVHKALEKHVDKSNSSRNVSLTQSTNSSDKETFENTTTREIVNPNISRVLNFVFRNLVQEYLTITYLNDIKIGFTNGHPESARLYPIEHLDILLNDVIEKEECKKKIKEMILCQYETVQDFSGVERPFLKEVPENKKCADKTSYITKIPKLKYFYDTVEEVTETKEQANKQDIGVLHFGVDGVILNVNKFILNTDSVIIDSLLGQASAIDCFNANVQEEKKNELILNNLKNELAFETLKQIEDPIKRAEMYAEMFNPRQNIIND